MDYTENYDLKKPNITELYLVTVFNANMDTIDTILKQIADSSGGDVPDNVVTTDDVATITKAGIIKLYSSGGTNRSGLLVQADGALLVNANAAYGTQRTGDGKLTTAGATEAEIDAGTNEYKPITPATIKYAVEKYAPGGGMTGPIGTDDIEDDAVTQPKIADGAVDNRCLASNAVATDNVEDGAITAPKIADGAITPGKATFTQYSETPVQIGNWIDGTPVWRQSFDYQLTAVEVSDKVFQPNIKVDAVANLSHFLDSKAVWRLGTDWATYKLLEHEDGHILDFVLPSNAAVGDHVYGYIDFVVLGTHITS